MKKILMGAFCSALCLSSCGFAKTGVTGFYIGANVGGMYTNSLKEYARHSSQDSDDQTELFELSKDFGFVVGLHVGYGYEMNCGFYVGAQVYANYDFTKIDNEDDGKGSALSRTFKNNEKSVNGTLSYEIDELKPMFGYGAAIQLGFKVTPNVLVYGSFGVEGTHTTVKQALVAVGEDGVLGVQNDFGSGFKFKPQGQDAEVSLSSNGGDEVSVEMISLVPGVGAKWFIKPNVYVGAQVDFLIGINKKIDSKYYNTKLSTSDANVQVNSLADNGFEMYINRKFALRYGLTAGYKF